MPATTRIDPFRNYSFIVEIDGIASSAFKSVSGLAAEVEVIEYREGSDTLTSSRKLPGRVRYPNVRLSRGLTTSRDLWDWWETVVNGTVERRDVAIVLLDDARNAVLRWVLQEAWIAKFEAPADLDATGNEVAIETIELAHEGFRLVA
jgi:phage tail-like protein